MSIGGNLRTMPFADLLQWVSQSQKTGTLAIDGKVYSKKVYFRNGQVVAASSDNPKEFLSYYLVGWGFLEEDELEELLDMQDRHGTMLGELLVIVGRLTRDELVHVLKVKTEEVIFDLFLWDEGEFRFLDNILPAKRFQPLDLAVDVLILEGVRRKDEWERIRSKIPGGHWRPRLVRAVEVKSLGQIELAVLRETNGTNSVERIALACRLPEFHVANFLYQGLTQGLFELVPGEEDPVIPGFTQSSWRVVLKHGERELVKGELLQASERVHQLRTNYSGNKEVQEIAADLEKRIEGALEAAGLEDDVVPELAIAPADLPKIDCNPEEGFLLSRVNGSYTLGEVLSLLPGAELRNKVLVAGLLERKVLRLRERASGSKTGSEGLQAG